SRAGWRLLQHTIDIYTGETNQVVSVWRAFGDEDLSFRPHPRSSAVIDIFKHQLLSERRFFGEFLGAPEPNPSDMLPIDQTVAAYTARMAELAGARLPFLASRDGGWWLEPVKFFDVRRERVWVFWRRVLHTA